MAIAAFLNWIRQPGNRFSLETPYAEIAIPLAFSATAVVSLVVTTCNRNGPDLQSSRFSTGIDCVYPSQQTGIICE